MDRMTKVIVVGSGISGLTSALRLQQAGASVTVATADNLTDTVSALAAAVWYPTHTAGNPRVADWARRTFDEFMKQAEIGVPGVAQRPTRMLLREPAPKPWWAEIPHDFRYAPSGEVPAGYAAEWRFTVPSAEMVPYLGWLSDRFIAAGGVVLRRRLSSLLDATAYAPVVVNTTGLAAGVLADDPAVHPARGQVVLVTNPGLTVSVRDEDHPDGMLYVHPRSGDVVLGGTFEPDCHDPVPAEATARAIVERCIRLVPELRGARVLGQFAGLRPARHGGARVEAEDGWLVHNYGHGGAGMTLSWGCADEVTRLALARGR
ncbi:FAD-dependent oxidoreductase [Actinoplanes regularis]|uniref:FAD-dependent oxidoreductase n=1 Tax=Actinoplanes regularis TaxID=52697 RepID=UPI00249FC208|nr:FAD-dependent oxidoreductase [Actinoplanes regularis]GLW35501.1 D-amino-acid oxidase [Actinoplanes regularis]